MADAGLDDFFAKKDKSKKKSKSKFTATDILEKKDDLTVLKKIKKKKEKKDQSQKTESDTPSRKGDDEEWVDYVDEVKDYSGLRIQTLQLSSKEEGTDDKDTDENLGSEDEDGETRQKKDSQQGPWKGPQAPPTRQPTPPPVEEAPPVKEETPEPPKTVGKYVPPSRRAGMDGGGAPTSQGPTSSRRKKEAPNIQSEFDFPTLGGEPTGQLRAVSSGGHFERVRGGGKQSEDPSRQQQKLELGNKFDALTSTD